MDGTARTRASLKATLVEEDHVPVSQARSNVRPLRTLLWDTNNETQQKDKASEQMLSLPLEMHNTHTFRLQMRQRLFDLYLGAANHGRPTFVYEMFDTRDPSKATTTAAMDTLCIAQIATSFRDENLMGVARIMYGKAIRLLNFKIGSICRMPPNHVQFEDVISGIYTLIICAWFECIGGNTGDSIRHCHGLSNLLQRHGLKSTNTPSRETLYSDWGFRMLGLCLYARRRMPSGIVHAQPPKTPNSSFFRDCMFQVPDLLERTDRFLEGSGPGLQSETHVISLLTALGQFVALLKKQHLQWASEMPPRFRMVSVRNFKDFTPLCKKFFGVFPTAYIFAQSSFEGHFRASFMCLLELDQAILSIHEAYPTICAQPALKLQHKTTTYDAAVAADTLCMLVPWSAQVQHGSFACTYSLMPLYYASKYYLSQGKQEQLAWCKQVSESFSAKYGISIDCASTRVDE